MSFLKLLALSLFCLIASAALADDKITCRLKYLTRVSYNGKKIEKEAIKEKAKSPSVFTGLKSNNPKMLKPDKMDLIKIKEFNGTYWLLSKSGLTATVLFIINTKRKMMIQHRSADFFGNFYGQNWMGPCSITSSSATSFDDIREKAKQGNADAQVNLGVMYKKGEGVLKDYKKPAKAKKPTKAKKKVIYAEDLNFAEIRKLSFKKLRNIQVRDRDKSSFAWKKFLLFSFLKHKAICKDNWKRFEGNRGYIQCLEMMLDDRERELNKGIAYSKNCKSPIYESYQWCMNNWEKHDMKTHAEVYNFWVNE